jgi:hypothetical protein
VGFGNTHWSDTGDYLICTAPSSDEYIAELEYQVQHLKLGITMICDLLKDVARKIEQVVEDDDLSSTGPGGSMPS